MITATRKTGFLIEDGTKLGTAIAYLRTASTVLNAPHVRDIAEYLNDIAAKNYFEQVPSVEQIEVVP